ncbi:MAG: endonuclease/exonuclease/phosphatase family protein [Dehalococcoidia bacterium]
MNVRDPADALRIVAWNIRAGGGRRADAIVAQLARWRPDAVALSEFRATPPSGAIAEAMRELGLVYQRTTADPRDPRTNALLVAARWPLRRVGVRRAPVDRHRWLLTRVAAPAEAGGAFALGAMHIPNYATGRKLPFLDAVHASVRAWRGGPAVLVGDTNTGRMGVDEETAVFDRRHHDWMDAMHDRWPDALRHLHGDETRVFTWYSPNGGNGFRLDEAFVAPGMLPRLLAVRHEWGAASGEAAVTVARRDALSDHAALILDFATAP